jgi:hypothetical protein
VLIPASSDSGTYLLTQWATSPNPAAGVAANYLLQVAQRALNRAWLLPSERVRFTQAMRKLAEVPAFAARAKAALGQFETRFQRGLAGKVLAAEKTQGAAESLDSLVQFLAPKRKPMTIATYKNPVGVLIDIWFGSEEAPPFNYPSERSASDANLASTWKYVGKIDGSRIEDVDKETLARLEWAAGNASAAKLREALLQIGQAEGDLAPLSGRLALEGLVLLADQGDTEAETEAIKIGWRKP